MASEAFVLAFSKSVLTSGFDARLKLSVMFAIEKAPVSYVGLFDIRFALSVVLHCMMGFDEFTTDPFTS